MCIYIEVCYSAGYRNSVKITLNKDMYSYPHVKFHVKMYPHLKIQVNMMYAAFVTAAEEARLLREATQGMGGAPMGSSSGMSPMPVSSFPQGTPGSTAPGLFPGMESQDPFRSTGTGTGLTFTGTDSIRSGFQGSSPVRPGGFQGTDPSRPMFPGASSFPGTSASVPGAPSAFSPDLQLGGSQTGMGDSGLMRARPLGTPPSFPGSLSGGPGSMMGSAAGLGSFTPGSGVASAGAPGVPLGTEDPRAIGEASLIMSDASGTYYNFFAYTGSEPIRVGITKSGFCPMPRRTPTVGPPRCEQACSSDDECTPLGAAQKCCPVEQCSIGCVDPRAGTPMP